MIAKIAAVQTSIHFYTELEPFRRQIADAVARAMRHEPDLIVFPEDVGTGLVALGAPLAVHGRSLRQVVALVSVYHPGALLRGLFRPSLSPPRALLLSAAARMREAYVDTFSDLAAAHGVHIAAGSILLPHEGAGDEAVYNTFHLFGPDGGVLGTADKVNLIPLEAQDGLHLTPGRREELTVWETPLGVIGPLVCFDAWDAELTARLVAQGAQVLLVPSANPEIWTDDVLAERKEGLYARVRELGVPGVEPFAVGSLAGLPFQGQSWILSPDPAQPEGVGILARARTATEPEIIMADVELPVPASPQM